MDYDDATARTDNRDGSVNRTNPYARSDAKSKQIQAQANTQNKKARTSVADHKGNRNDRDAHQPETVPTTTTEGTTDPLKKTLARDLERLNSDRKTVITVKLRFKPDLKYKHYGDPVLRPIDNPIIGHLRKFMRQCSEVTGDTAVFQTFTTNREFDYKHCLRTDEEARKELLADKQQQGKYTHVMMLKIILVSNPFRFKSYLGNWLRTNNTVLLDYSYPKKEVETVRIGYIHSKHLIDTYRTDYQEELNVKLNAEVNKASKPERMKTILEETGDVEGNILQIRIINQYISWGRGERKTETRGLVIECLKVDRQYVLKRIPAIFETTQFRFVPFSLAYDRNVPDSATQYHNLLKSHKAFIKKLYTFSILGLKEKEMTELTPEDVSIRKQLLLGDVILGVEKTPGTFRSGKWNIITTKPQRAEAEKYFDGIMMQRLGNRKESLADGVKIPYRAQVSQVPIEYIEEVLVTDQSSTLDTNISALTSNAASKLEGKMEGMLSKCESTMQYCQSTIKGMESLSQAGIKNMQEDWRKERNKFKQFLTDMSEKQDKKFSELYKFQQEQEIVNDLVDSELDQLGHEVTKLKDRVTQIEDITEDLHEHLMDGYAPKPPAFTEDDDSMHTASHNNPQGASEDWASKRLRTKTRSPREHSRRYSLAKLPKKARRSRKKQVSQEDSEDDLPRTIRKKKQME